MIDYGVFLTITFGLIGIILVSSIEIIPRIESEKKKNKMTLFLNIVSLIEVILFLLILISL